MRGRFRVRLLVVGLVCVVCLVSGCAGQRQDTPPPQWHSPVRMGARPAVKPLERAHDASAAPGAHESRPSI